jgi:hypothetical protein
MKELDIPKSGKRGLSVAFKSRFGQCQRQYVSPRKRSTTAQRESQSAFGSASLGWSGLTNEQRDAWCEFAKNVLSHPRGGTSGPLTGQMLFTAINRNQTLLGLPPFVYPPERPAFEPNPVTALSITQDGDGIAIKLSVTKSPAVDLLVFASRPYNAGRRYCDKFSYLGPLPPPVGGECDVTAPYVKKHGKPWPGSRIFLLTVQQVNGWRDQPHRIEAVFRPSPAPPPQSKRRQAAVAGQ